MLSQGDAWPEDHILILSKCTMSSKTKDSWFLPFLPISLATRSQEMMMKSNNSAIPSTSSFLSSKNAKLMGQTPTRCSPTWEKTVLSTAQKLAWPTKSSGVGASSSSTPKVTSWITMNLSSSQERLVQTSSACSTLLQNDNRLWSTTICRHSNHCVCLKCELKTLKSPHWFCLPRVALWPQIC